MTVETVDTQVEANFSEDSCMVCGRTTDQLEQINTEPTLTRHQGVTKCLKCIVEYQAELIGDETAVGEDSSESDSNVSEDVGGSDLTWN